MSDNNLTPDDLYVFLKASGFEVGSTGGGCTAWMLSLTGGGLRSDGDVYVMITNDADHDFGSEQDVAEDGILVGVFDGLGEVWHGIAMHCDDVPPLVARAMLMGPQGKRGRTEEEAYGGVDVVQPDIYFIPKKPTPSAIDQIEATINDLKKVTDLLIAGGAS